MRSLPFERFREVLAIRTDHVGDLILSTPFLRALRKAVPGARLSALVTPYTRGVLEGSDLVDVLLTTLPARGEVRYDLAVCLAPRSRAHRLAYRSGARYRLGYTYAGRPLVRAATLVWLTHRLVLPIRRQLALGQTVPHEVEQLGQLAREMGLDYEDRTLVLPVRAADRQAVMQRLNGRTPPPVALHLHAGWLRQGWSAESLAHLLGNLAAQVGGLLVTYGPAEEGLARDVEEALPGVEGIAWLGGLTLTQWAAALELSSCVVSTDTGAVHVAAAVKRPVVVVFKPESYSLNSQQWAPWQVPHRSLIHEGPSVTGPEILCAVADLLGPVAKVPRPNL